MSTPALEAAGRATIAAGVRGSDARAGESPATRIRAVPRRRLPILGALWFCATVTLLVFGCAFPLRRYIVPARGLGYGLGIAGGSMMLLLFLYSARKHAKWLSFLGPTSRWFRFHMAMGVLGPLCILYHCDFSLGATNSNVALFSMLTVAASGLVGRYLYAHIHRGVYGQKLTLAELRERAEGLRTLPGTVEFLPDLVGRLESVEQRMLAAGSRLPVLAVMKPPIIATLALVARWRVHRHIRRQLRRAARTSSVIAGERKRFTRAACAYADRRIAATRRLAAFQAFERLFSLWHALHIPLIFLMLAAATVHVIAVSIF